MKNDFPPREKQSILKLVLVQRQSTYLGLARMETAHAQTWKQWDLYDMIMLSYVEMWFDL
jgi:hypothetical protein